MSSGAVTLVAAWIWSVRLLNLMLRFAMGVLVRRWSGILGSRLGSAVAVACITCD